MRGARAWWSAAAASALAWMPGAARACPVCFVGQSEENLLAYQISSAVLTFLPFVLVGGLLFWIVRRVREADAATLAAREHWTEPAE